MRSKNNSTGKAPRMTNKKFMDNEKARDLRKKAEEPAGPASNKNLNRRRENKLLQSQNLLPTNKDAELD